VKKGAMRRKTYANKQRDKLTNPNNFPFTFAYLSTVQNCLFITDFISGQDQSMTQPTSAVLGLR